MSREPPPRAEGRQEEGDREKCFYCEPDSEDRPEGPGKKTGRSAGASGRLYLGKAGDASAESICQGAKLRAGAVVRDDGAEAVPGLELPGDRGGVSQQPSLEKRQAIGLRDGAGDGDGAGAGGVRVPDHCTLQRFFKGLTVEAVEQAQRLSAWKDPWENAQGKISVQQWPEELLRVLSAEDSAAADSTGLQETGASRYYAKPSGPAKRTASS